MVLTGGLERRLVKPAERRGMMGSPCVRAILVAFLTGGNLRASSRRFLRRFRYRSSYIRDHGANRPIPNEGVTANEEFVSLQLRRKLLRSRGNARWLRRIAAADRRAGCNAANLGDRNARRSWHVVDAAGSEERGFAVRE